MFRSMGQFFSREIGHDPGEVVPVEHAPRHVLGARVLPALEDNGLHTLFGEDGRGRDACRPRSHDRDVKLLSHAL